MVGICSLTIIIKIDIANRESIPRLSFSLLSLLVEAGVKNPVTATRVMTEVGMTKLTI